MTDWTIIKLLSWTESYFKDRSIDSPRLTAEILLAHCLGIQRLDLYLQYDRPLQKNELSDFKVLIKRRSQNEPVAYITGEKGFFESDFEVAKGVLIPRPDTETIVEAALQVLGEKKDAGAPKTVLEMGVGSGAIIVSLAKALPGHLYFASDISFTAIEIAKKNAEKLARDRIAFFAGSWFSSIKETSRFDVILSNPPYIPTRDIENLQPEIRGFEPLHALDGGRDGFDCFRSILDRAHTHLVPGGTLLLEMGFDQKQGLGKISQGYAQYEPAWFIKDLAGHHRVAVIKKAID